MKETNFSREVLKVLWDEEPQTMLDRFCLTSGCGNGVTKFSEAERLEKILEIDQRLLTKYQSKVYLLV